MKNFHLKDYTQTSENKLSLARTWSVNNISFAQKIYRHKNSKCHGMPPSGDYDIPAGNEFFFSTKLLAAR